jgi:hypothetical protein
MILRMQPEPINALYDGVVQVLYGDSTSIWAPCMYQNTGSAGTVPTSGVIYVDSLVAGSEQSPTLPQLLVAILDPAISMHGGLHTVILKADGFDQDAETDETDNYFAMQVSVVPTKYVRLGTSITRPQPPNPTAGNGILPAPFYFNKDGVRLDWLPTTRGTWSAVAVHAVNGANYDMGIFDPATGQTAGFRTPLASSVSSGSKTEIIVLNQSLLPKHDRDLGVVYQSGSGNYIAESRMAPDNIPMTINSAVTGNLAAGQMVAVEEFQHVPSASMASVRVRVETTPGVTLRVAWMDPSFSMIPVNNFSQNAATDVQGNAVLDVPVPTSGTGKRYGLIVYRDMADGGVAPVAYTLRVLYSPNYTNLPIPGWIGTIGVANGTPVLTSDPPTLTGAPTVTSVIFAQRNNGNVDGLTGSYRLLLDGGVAADKTMTALAPDQIETIQPAFPLIQGGRHTISYQLDYANVLPEFDETDNAWGKQWTWTPAVQGSNTATRNAPDAHGGWSDLPASVTPLDNLDGTRATFTPTSLSYYGLTLMMPDAGNTNSLTYYQPGSGPSGAFSTPVFGITSQPGRTAGILGDFPATTTYDAGVERVSGNGGYRIQNMNATDLGALPITTVTQSINAGQIGRLFSFKTVNAIPINLQVLLQNLSGNADLALAVYQHVIAQFGVRDVANTTFADANSAAGNEQVTLPIQQDLTEVAIVVYKTNAADLSKAVTFAVRTNGGATADVGDALPHEIAFALAGENPVRTGGSTLRFDLPAAGDASLELYNVTGQRVRTLASGARAAGSYTLDWDGRGEDGRVLPGGVYFARFRTGSFTRTIRVSLVR